jgi:hypothetical protein
MNFGTKGCMYNCGDECTGECIKVETKTKMRVAVKSIFKKEYMSEYQKWTEVSQFLACGLQGVRVKRKIDLKDLKPKQR